MARVLLIDDDASLLDVLAMAFAAAGHDVETARDGRAGLDAIRARRPEVVVADVNMPVLDGFAMCRKLRQASDDVPVVLLTSRDDEIDEALGLELGADDYVAKPFSTRVLLLRVDALIRRQHARAEGPGAGRVRRAGRLELDGERLEARYAGTRIATTVTEFRLLEALTARPGVVRSRDALLDAVRGDDSVVASRIVDTYVRRLRRKLEAVDPAFDAIETLIGAGYRWRDEPA